MRFPQKVFIAIAMIALIQIIFSDYAVSVIPGWHITISNYFWIGPFFQFIYFLAVAVIYGWIPNQKIKAGYFWTHALLSLIPLLFAIFGFTGIYLSDLFVTKQLSDYQLINKIELYLNYLFALNQIVFIIFVFILQSKAEKKIHTV